MVAPDLLGFAEQHGEDILRVGLHVCGRYPIEQDHRRVGRHDRAHALLADTSLISPDLKLELGDLMPLHETIVERFIAPGLDSGHESSWLAPDITCAT